MNITVDSSLSGSGNGTNVAQLQVPLSSMFIPATYSDGSGKVAQVRGMPACELAK